MADAEDRSPARVILVVDDDLTMRLVVARMLESHGHVVRLAASGTAALLMLARAPDAVDLVLSDIRMPGMSGVDLALEVHRAWPWLMVVLMSYELPEVVSRHPELAGIPFLRKPFDREELLNLLDLATLRVTPRPHC